MTFNSDRVIGRHRGTRPGPTLVCVGAMHGNEPAGVAALRRVFERLDQLRPPFRGELVGIIGNLAALAAGQRFLEKDLNRQWRPEDLERLDNGRPNGRLAPEDRELLELREAVHAALPDHPADAYFLDLHTTSSRSVPFCVVGDTLPNRAFALRMHVPVVLGFEEYLEGTLPEYVSQLGCVTVGFEAGRHDDPRSVDFAESAVWVALEGAGIVSSDDVPEIKRRRHDLAEATRQFPRFVEIFDRHPVERREDFQMLPGFENFQPVTAGQVLARERHVDVPAADTALLFMPLYQEQGYDGFFLTRPIKPFWMKMSTVLRRMHLGAIPRWLPGVRPHPTRPHTLLVNRRVARWQVVHIFHLLGYRHRRSENGQLVFTRRLHDTWQKNATVRRRVPV